jgi:hypothetical protein
VLTEASLVAKAELVIRNGVLIPLCSIQSKLAAFCGCIAAWGGSNKQWRQQE